MSVLNYSEVHLNDDFADVFQVFKELRTNLIFEDFVSTFTEAHAQGYQLISMKNEKGQILGLIGMRMLVDFVHGKHVYIDDLVITSDYRSQSLGAKFLEFAENYANKMGCQGMRLCTGKENVRGMKFYEANHWDMRAVVYKKKLLP